MCISFAFDGVCRCGRPRRLTLCIVTCLTSPPVPTPPNEQKGSVEDLTTWQARSAKKFPNQMGAGHVYVKLKGKAT